MCEWVRFCPRTTHLTDAPLRDSQSPSPYPRSRWAQLAAAAAFQPPFCQKKTPQRNVRPGGTTCSQLTCTADKYKTHRGAESIIVQGPLSFLLATLLIQSVVPVRATHAGSSALCSVQPYLSRMLCCKCFQERLQQKSDQYKPWRRLKKS